MDQFYQTLRQIQKKENNNGTLARVEETFYNDMHEYINMLKQEAINDPFSKAPEMLKNAQMVATDVCQKRETKITNSAILNIQRSYHLFTGKPQFDLVDTTPLNLTPEEERFYYSLIDTLKNHRHSISLESLSDDDKESSSQPIIKPKENNSSTLTPDVETQEEIKSQPIIKPKTETPQQEVKPEPVIKPKDESKLVEPTQQVTEKPKPPENIEENPNAFDNQDEFIDFESRKVAKDTELVTMLVFDDVGAIVGVDEKVYGPFRSQDIVTLPLINAKIFFKNRKGRKVKI